MSGEILIQQPGNSVVTDLGRTRGPRFGLPVNGALDQFSARAANILAGNPDNDPLVEITALDFRMRATTDILIAVTGAPLTSLSAAATAQPVGTGLGPCRRNSVHPGDQPRPSRLPGRSTAPSRQRHCWAAAPRTPWWASGCNSKKGPAS